MSLKEYVERYQNLGFSIFPCAYKSKRPSLDSWKQYQTRKPTEKELAGFFGENHTNIAIVCGQVSGNLMVLDCDTEEKYPEFKRLAEQRLAVEDFRQECIQKGFNRAAKFSWEKTGCETVALYKKLLEKK